MVHPEAAADSFLAPLHRSFLISCFVSGAAALFVLPLHLALAGPPHAAVLLVLAWMLCQWPLALLLSRSGALDRAIGLSASLFALCVAAICAVTGGLSSFALAWLLLPPVEAAFATGRRVPLVVTLLCAGLVGALALAPLPAAPLLLIPAALSPVAVTAAVLYAGVLALRLTLDRTLARGAVRACEARLRSLSLAVSDIVCELAPDGALDVLGGPVKDLIGESPATAGGDWLFARLHVADRPLYLTRVSDLRHGGTAEPFEVRLRTGAARPGEPGRATYRRMDLRLTAVEAAADGEGGGRPVLITLRDLEASTVRHAEAAPLSGGLVAKARSAARSETAQAQQTAQTLQSSADTVTAPGGGAGAGTGAGPLAPKTTQAIDISACLDQCRDLLTPVAARRGILLDLEAGHDLPLVAGDSKLLRQALYCVLTEMSETCAEDAVVSAAVTIGTGRLECVVSVVNRHAGPVWTATASAAALETAAGLLRRTGGDLAVRARAGQADRVRVYLPLWTGAEHAAAGPLAKTA